MTDETKLTPMQKVDELIERGKSKGELTYKEVIDTLGNDALDVDQMEVVYDRFEDADINVVEEIDPVEIAGEDVTEIDPKLAVTEGIAIDDPVRMYLKEIGRVPLLTSDQEIDIAKRMADGDEEAKQQLAEANLRLVVSVAKRYVGRGMQFLDLIQEGNLGLIKAVDKFDLSLNLAFSTYAVPMIIGEIRRYLRDNNSIRVSRSLRDIAYKAIYTRENYMKQHLKEPTVTEIAQEIGIEKEMIVYALDAIQNPVSLFEPVYTEGGDTLYVMDQISDKKNKEERWIENLALREAMQRLNSREKHIIELRFYEGKTQMEVAQEIGISQAQVSRLEKNALKSMRNYLRP